MEPAFTDDPRLGTGRKLSAKDEALLVAVACSKPPVGRARWTLELLAGEVVRLTEHDRVSRETVRRRLHEKALKPWQKKMWCIPAVDAEFVATSIAAMGPRTCSCSSAPTALGGT